MKNQFWPKTYEFLKRICFFDTGPWRFPFEYGFGGEGVSALKKKKVSLGRCRYSQMGVSGVSADSLLLMFLLGVIFIFF